MNLVLRLLIVVMEFLNVLIMPLLWFKDKKPRKVIPQISDCLLKISATELAEKIRKQEITSELICKTYIRRIKEVNPFLNAVVEERFESALQDARNVDAYLLTSQESKEEIEKTKPLLGVPLTVKESCSVAGMSLAVGTLPRLGIKADRDSVVVSRLRNSGAIILLVSNTAEFCLGWETCNFVTGRTNNPHDVKRTAGGSSGGEAALLASGGSLIGIGSDIAGSIRLPAMFNGIYGHKPTARSVAFQGHYPYSTDERYPDYFTIGPMTRYAKDLKLMMKIMATESVLPELHLETKVELNQLRIFHMDEESTSLTLPSVQNEISFAIKQSVEYLRDKCKCTIEDFKFSALENGNEIGGSLLYTLNNVPNILKSEKHNLLLEVLKSFVGASNYTFNLMFFYLLELLFKNVVYNDVYVKENEHLKQLLKKKLGDDGVLLYPTFHTTAFYHNHLLLKTGGFSYFVMFNTLGLPATNVPCGFDKNGLPVGIQVVAGPNQDRLCFAVAEELEKCFGGWQAPRQYRH